MIYKFEYRNDTERQEIIEVHSEKYLIEEQNITEGNFLIFTDEFPLPSVEVQIDELKQDTLILMDALAVTYEEILMLKMQLGGTI